MAVFATDQPYAPSLDLGRPLKLFNSKRLRLSGKHPHTQADPFLLEHEGALYIFYEAMTPRRHGRICAFRTTDLTHFEPLGIVLEEPWHISFPFAFRHEGRAYMLPDSSAVREVRLYEIEPFPYPRPCRTLLRGEFMDPHLLRHEGVWYLFATRRDGRVLEIHVSDDLLNGEFTPHPANPISSDPRYSRSAGAIIVLDDGRLCRVAQDCSERYGTNVSLHIIEEISPTSYRESVAVETLFRLDQGWDALGAHHLAVARYNGLTVAATDGLQADDGFNRLLGGISWLGDKLLGDGRS